MSEALPENVVLTTLDAAINWGRTHSTWPMFFGLSCCFVEMSTALTPNFDIARFGAEVIRGTPRQADLMVISGTPFKKMGPVILRVYEQMANPKWVISMGSCANSGGMYDTYSVIQGVDQILPVDVYIPGCPPRPEALLEALLLLQEKIRGNERPARPVLGLKGGSEGTTGSPRIVGLDKNCDPRGPGFGTSPVRGSAQTEPDFFGRRNPLLWTPPQPRLPLAPGVDELLRAVAERFGERVRLDPDGADLPTLLVGVEDYLPLLAFLKTEGPRRYRRLETLTAIDERARSRRPGHDYTLVCLLLNYDGPDYLRVKVPLSGPNPACPSLTGLWPAANWYEREVYDLFGIDFPGHPHLTRLLMPQSWQGHPLRKDHPARGSQMAPYTAATAATMAPPEAASFFPPEHDGHHLYLNIGPNHPGTHGVLRSVLKLDGEEIEAMDFEIGYHHRAAEKTAERQHWGQFIPYTDRIDYLAGVLNNLAYLNSLETLLGIEVPPRAAAIRILLCELSRISSHLVWFGTFGADVGAMTPVFYAFIAREKIFEILEMITGGRMHPAWLRIGGVAQDLPDGWKGVVDAFTGDFSRRLDELEKLLTDSPIFRLRTEGVGIISRDEALDWGMTGPVLRATGLAWDLRRTLPYGGYERVDFEVATASGGDCFARYQVHLLEMRQSLRIVQQVAASMPAGPWLSGASRFTRPPRERMLHDIESLIDHFVNVSRGPTAPRGEVYRAIESSKGECGYYIVSDGLSTPYRLHIRTPSFANMQMVPQLCRGWLISDLMAILGSMDYVLADIDR